MTATEIMERDFPRMDGDSRYMEKLLSIWARYILIIYLKEILNEKERRITATELSHSERGL